jgi:hypothetical protein
VRPPPPTDPRPTDLLAAARRRLPVEVDVVELAAGPDDGRQAARVPRVAGGLLAGAVALSGCGPSAAEVRGDAAGSKAHVLAVSRDVLGPLAADGTYPRPPRGTWSGCDDLGGKALYQVSARLDPTGDGPGALVDAVRARLSLLGLTLRPEGRADAEVLTLRGARDGLRVRVTGYRDEPVVLLDLFGPCLEVGDVDDELWAEPPEQLALGVTS